MTGEDESLVRIGLVIILLSLILFVVIFIVRYPLNVTFYYMLSAIFYGVNPITVKYDLDDKCNNDEKCYNSNLLVYSIIFFIDFLLFSFGLALAS